MVLTTKEAQVKIDAAVEHLQDEMKKLRTGRANAGMLDGIKITVYGQSMPLVHVATLAVLDAQMIQIAPFDPSNLDAISSAIREDQSLDLNPSDDGKVVRVPIPPMTQERRLEVVKVMKAKQEEANVSVRNIRHDLLKSVKTQVKDKQLSEDDEHRIEKEFSEMMDRYKAISDQIIKDKEVEIMVV